MSKTRDTGFLGNVVKVDASGNVSFVSGSTTLATINTSGQLSGSSPVLSSSYASNAELLDGLDSTVFTLTSSFNAQTASFTAFSSSINSFSASILSYTASQNITNGTFTTTASFNAQTASFTAFTASILTQTASLNAFSASVLSYTSSLNAKTASFATTGSNTFIGTQTITGSVLQSGSFTSTGTLTAQTLVVQTITSSVVYSSGSNVFGNSIGNTQTFTGSVLVTGSLTISTGGNASAPIIFGSTIACSPVGLFSGCVGIGTQAPQSLLHVASGANIWSLNAGCACTPYNTNSAGFYTNAGNISLTNQFGTINWPEDYTTPSTAKPWWLLGNRSGTAGQWQLTLRTGYSGGGGLDREVITVYTTGADTSRTVDCIKLSTGAGVEAMKINSAGVTSFASTVCSNGLQSTDSLILRKDASVDNRYIQLCNTQAGGYRWDLVTRSTAQGCGFGILNNTTSQYALLFDANNVAIFACQVCANLVTAPTISAGIPTNSRIVANANTMYGYYDVEVNPRWILGRDVWTGGSGGLAFGLGNTSTCYSMIGDPSGYGCTIAFAILVPTGCSGTTYEKMRITSGGEVGIGVIPTSGNRFWVKGSSTSGGDTTIIAQNSAGTNLFYVLNNGNVIMPSGNVGIATDAPSTKLEVCSGYIKNIGATNASGYLYYNTSANYTLSLSGNASYAQLYSTDNIALMFGNNNLSRMFIQTNGFIGIATTSPKAVFDVACGNAHSIISTWCKGAASGTMYNAFDIYMDEASFAGQLYVQANGAGIGIQATYDVLASYDRICIIPRNSMTRGQGETLTIPSYTVGGGSKRICIQQSNTSTTSTVISAMLIGTAYGGSYICAQA